MFVGGVGVVGCVCVGGSGGACVCVEGGDLDWTFVLVVVT